jgi:hypothetical protein
VKGFFKNWQTTLAGLIAAIATLGAEGVQKPDGTMNWPNIVLATAMAVFGAVAKSHNVTGGTVGVTAEAQARTGEAKTLTTAPGVPMPPPAQPIAKP